MIVKYSLIIGVNLICYLWMGLSKTQKNKLGRRLLLILPIVYILVDILSYNWR